MKILLINPANENDVDRRILRELTYLGDLAFFAPHACAVVAALTDPEHEVRIHDEAILGPVDSILMEETFDVVGISLIANAFLRAIAIAECFRASGRSGILVAGGACMLHMVEALRGVIDVAFVGEAEETWPLFLKEYAEGRHRPIYRQIAKPDLSKMPVPRWELVRDDLPRYSVAAVQTVRGCPHDCSFCDVIYNFGRKLRFKPIEQVIEEIVLLESLGVEMIFFADDNFAANRKHTKEILRRIVEVNKTFDVRIGFATQVDITIADDDELLQLLLDANFLEVQIGIESVKPASLKDLQKQHNLRYDLVEAVKKIQSYGIIVLAHMIVGIDSDDADIFEQSARFLDAANLVHQASHPLMAPPGTKLWYQLRMEGRLVVVSPDMQDRMDLYTNIVPKRLSRIELIEGLTEYRLSVSESERFLSRARGFAAGVTHQTSYKVKNEPPLRRNLKMLFSMIRYYLFRADKGERRVFFTLLRETARRHSFLMPRIFYSLVSHTMERRYAESNADRAAEILTIERGTEGGPTLMSKTVLIAPAVRERFEQIATAAYRHVRKTTADRETLYNVLVEALRDYTLTFQDAFETFDNYQLDAVQKSCDRVTGSLVSPLVETDAAMPKEAPSGFAREILDAMDQTMRFGLGATRGLESEREFLGKSPQSN